MHSADLLDDPEGIARAYCAAVGIPFIAEALEWEAGDRSEVSWYNEGTGAWHDNLRESTGIQKPTTTYAPLEENPRLFELYERAVPLYEDMLAHAFAPQPSTNPNPNPNQTANPEEGSPHADLA